ncbi:hypothetical protein SAMN05421553_3873 [Pseudomonas anguilliseptica]|uniref:Uncharacterized protein n=1 Tax=Pseudomonas anguilliseptica TaxID=53406 RepID=A0A1H5FI29_PSEAG|nr:hypothetical protein SAMN05421553_3873 [Pseudomonas anguilliseptica]
MDLSGNAGSALEDSDSSCCCLSHSAQLAPLFPPAPPCTTQALDRRLNALEYLSEKPLNLQQ